MSIDAPPSAVEETGQGGGLPTPVRRRTEGVGEEDMGRSRAVLRPSRRSETQGEQLLLSRQRERQALRRLRLQNSHLAQKEVETQSHGRRERERAREMESEREREGMQSKELVRQGEEDSVRDWQRMPAFHPRPLPQPQPERRSELDGDSEDWEREKRRESVGALEMLLWDMPWQVCLCLCMLCVCVCVCVVCVCGVFLCVYLCAFCVALCGVCVCVCVLQGAGLKQDSLAGKQAAPQHRRLYTPTCVCARSLSCLPLAFPCSSAPSLASTCNLVSPRLHYGLLTLCPGAY